jgi:hypothetical protein
MRVGVTSSAPRRTTYGQSGAGNELIRDAGIDGKPVQQTCPYGGCWRPAGRSTGRSCGRSPTPRQRAIACVISASGTASARARRNQRAVDVERNESRILHAVKPYTG